MIRRQGPGAGRGVGRWRQGRGRLGGGKGGGDGEGGQQGGGDGEGGNREGEIGRGMTGRGQWGGEMGRVATGREGKEGGKHIECLGLMRLQFFLTLFTRATPGTPASSNYNEFSTCEITLTSLFMSALLNG